MNWQTHSKGLQGDGRWALSLCSARSGWCCPAQCWPLPTPVFQTVLTAAVSVCMYLYTSLKSTPFSSLFFHYWSWVQVCRAGGEAALKGGQFFPLSVFMVPCTQRHRDSGKHRGQGPDRDPCTSGVGTSAFQVLSGHCALLLALAQVGDIGHSSLLMEKLRQSVL